MHLKMLAYHADQIAVTHVQDGADEGVLLRFGTDLFSYDVNTYGGLDLVALPVADSAEILQTLLNQIQSEKIVFKLISDSAVAQVMARFGGEQLRSFVSYGWGDSVEFRPDLEVVVHTEIDERLVEMFGRNGYPPHELEQFFNDGGHAFSLELHGQPASVGMIYRNFENIWEVGGLHTEPHARRRGLSKRIVRTALHTLQQLGYSPRYQVDATNVASAKLAQSLGLVEFLYVRHVVVNG